LSDQVSLWWFCADALRRHYATEFQDAQALKAALDETYKLGDPFRDAFEETQREFYQAHGYGKTEG
jgi:hypothetical protein